MNETVMLSKSKKDCFVRGKVKFPLAVGLRAVVITDEGCLTTSMVQKIGCIDRGLIRFETVNSNYSVTLEDPLIPAHMG